MFLPFTHSLSRYLLIFHIDSVGNIQFIFGRLKFTFFCCFWQNSQFLCNFEGHSSYPNESPRSGQSLVSFPLNRALFLLSQVLATEIVGYNRTATQNIFLFLMWWTEWWVRLWWVHSKKLSLNIWIFLLMQLELFKFNFFSNQVWISLTCKIMT